MAFLQRQINRGSVSTGYDVDNSVKLEQDNSEYLHKTPSSVGNRRTWTFSCWLKRTELSLNHYIFNYGDGDYNQYDRTLMTFRTGVDQIWFGGGSAYELKTNRVFRDSSAWYHIVLAVDTTQGTASNRLKLYINGVQETSFATASYPDQNFDYAANRNQKHSIGYNHTDSGSGFSGYMAEVIQLDGTAAAPTEFGEFDADSGIWKPIDVSGLTFGTNGFYLDFEDASNMGNDASGGTDFTEVNITTADQATDTPTNNFCTLNYINKCADTTMTDGATNCDRTNNGNNTVRGTMAVTKGKWYWEVHVGRGTVNTNYPFSGMTGNLSLNPCVWTHEDAQTFSVSGSGNVTDVSTHRGTGTAAAYSNATPAYSIYGFAVDIDNETLIWSTNGTANNSGNTYSLARSVGASTEGMTPMLFMFTGAQQSFNFGGYSIYPPSSAESDANGYGTFEYAPPSGYYALCGKNLAEYG